MSLTARVSGLSCRRAAPERATTGWRALPLLATVVVPAAALLSGCVSQEPIPILLRVATATGPCSVAHATGPLDLLGGAQLRLTIIGRTGQEKPPRLVCDELVRLDDGGGKLDLALPPSQGAEQLDLLVEVFDDARPPQLLAGGGLAEVNRKPRLEPLQALLAPSGRFACAPQPMLSDRAFHSATSLPSGEVLLVGGLTDQGPAGEAAGKLWFNDSIEIYDPRTGAFRAATGEGPEGRAFHSAWLLDGPAGGPYDVLLLGGLTAGPSAGPAMPAAEPGAATDALPLMPAATAVTAGSVLLRYYPWASPPQVQTLSPSPRLRPRFAHATTAAGGQLVAAGGANVAGGSAMAAAGHFEISSSASSEHYGPYPLKHSRVGAMAAALSSDAVLVFGGNLGSSADAAASEAIEVIALGEKPASATAKLEAGSLANIAPVAYGTLTTLETEELLLAGGLTVEQGRAQTVLGTSALKLISRVQDEIRVKEVAAPVFQPVAYHVATSLPGNDVFLSGGAPSSCAPLQCASSSTYRFSAARAVLTSDSSLNTARFGHTVNLLPGGALLVTGGLGHDGSSLMGLAAAELLFSGYGSATADVFDRAPGQVSATRCDR